MVNSMPTLSKKLYRSLLSNPRFSQASMSLFTNNISSHEDSDLEELSANLDTESPIESKVSDPISLMSGEERVMEERALGNDLDSDIYKAILMGQVGQLPLQKKLKSGRTITIFSVGTVIYLEGNLETKIFTDPITGLVRRIREVAISRNGRVVFLGKAGAMQQTKFC